MTPNLHLGPASHEQARFACKAWHYSRSLPTPPLVKIGVWEDLQFQGVIIFSRGANRHLAQSFGLAQTECCELSRVALRRGHQTPVSRVVSIALRLLRQQCAGLKAVVSFADPEQQHHGGIYQSMGWVYLGQSAPSRVYIDRRGRRWHPRMVSADGSKRVYGERRRVVRIADCTAEPVAGKHRYAWSWDAEVRARLEARRQPYPKRESSAESGTRATSPRGRINSTDSLQTIEAARG